jgi:hypothetical protein
METPISGVVILPGTFRAHNKGVHGGIGPVIRDVHGDGITRSTVTTVDEGIEVTAVAGVEKLSQALLTGSYIGGNQGLNVRAKSA